MVKNVRLLIVCIAIPLILGFVSWLFAGNGMEVFTQVNKPQLSPPGWLFPIVWAILYTLMGISSYLILASDKEKKKTTAIRLYNYQLIVNLLWPTFFFNLEWYFFAFLWLVLLWVLVLLMILKFKDINKLAAYLNIPYLVWLTFAGYLNLMIWFLN